MFQLVKTAIKNNRTRLYLYLSKITSQKTFWNLASTVSPLDAILDGYDNKSAFFKTGKIPVNFFVKQKLISKKSTTLQIGCGIGRVEKHLALLVKQSIGVDISDQMVRQAQQLVNYPNVKFIATDGEHLPIKNQTVDFVYSLLVFQHMPREMFYQNLAEVARILKPGGKLFFQIPIDELGVKADPAAKNPWVMRYYQRKEIFKQLKVVGFDIMKTFSGFETDDQSELQDNFAVLARKIKK